MKIFCIALGIMGLVLFNGCATKNKEVVGHNRPAAPPPRVEVRGNPPHTRAVWVPGHWEWRGRRAGYVWINGYWKP